MNKIFRIVWSEATQSWVAVSELTKAHKKKGSAKNVAAVAAAAIAALGVADGAWAANAMLNGTVAAGVDGAVSIGDSARVSGSGNSSGIAIGREATVGDGTQDTGNQTNAMAIGVAAKAKGAKSTALGSDASASNKYAIAVGSRASATQESSIAIGGAENADDAAQATGNASIALGKKSKAKGNNSFAANGATADTESNVIGFNASSGVYSNVFGSYATATGTGVTVIGHRANASGFYANAIGSNTVANGVAALAIGGGSEARYAAQATANYAIAVGEKSLANQSYAAAFGNEAKAQGENSTALGRQSKTGANSATALGYLANAAGTEAVAIGKNADASYQYGIAMGTNSKAAPEGVALGFSTESRGFESTAIGKGAKAGVAATVNNGVVTHLAGAQASTAIGNYASAEKAASMAIGSHSNANGTFTVAIGNGATAGDNTDSEDNSGQVAIGQGANAKGAYSTAIGKSAESSQFGTSIGKQAKTEGESSTAIGVYADAKGFGSVAIGGVSYDAAVANNSRVDDAGAANRAARTTGEGAVAIGPDAESSYRSVSLGIKSFTSGNRNVAVGNGATAQTTGSSGDVSGDAIAIGTSAQVTANYAMALGKGAKATGLSSIAFGNEASTNGTSNIVIGDGANAVYAANDKDNNNKSFTTNNSIAIGSAAKTQGDGSVVIGNSAKSERADSNRHNASNTVAIGTEADAGWRDSIAIGHGASTGQAENIAIGLNAKTTTGNNASIAVGSQSDATGNASSAFGVLAKATGAQATALGRETEASKNQAIAIGYKTKAQGSNTIAMGNGAIAQDYSGGIAIGDSANSAGQAAIAIGRNTSNTSAGSISLGDDADTTAENAMAMGTGAQATIANGVALGSSSVTTGNSGALAFNAGTNSTATSGNRTNVYVGNAASRQSGLAGVSVGTETQTRQINNLAGGTNDTDAVNVAQLKGVNLGFSGNNNTNGDVRLVDQRLAIEGDGDFITTKAEGNKLTLSVNQNRQLKYFSVNSSEAGNADNRGAKGTNSIAIGPNAASASNNAVAIGMNSTTSSEYAVSLGYNAKGVKGSSVAVGNGAEAQGTSTVALGQGAIAGDYQGAMALGLNANALGQGSVALGRNTKTSAGNSVAIGDGARTVGTISGAIAMGQSAMTVNDATAIGFNAKAVGAGSLAFGKGALAGLDNASAYETLYNNWQQALTEQTRINASSTATEQEKQNAAAAVTAYKTQLDQLANTSAQDANALAFGNQAKATKADAVAIGRSATVNNKTGVALGQGATVSVDGGVALGSGSAASTAAGQQAFDPAQNRGQYYDSARGTGAAARSTNGAVAVGGRQITNLAGGTVDTDAVNVAQLKAMNLKVAGDTTTGNADVRLVADTLTVKGADADYVKTNAAGQTISIDVTDKVKKAVENTEKLTANTISLGSDDSTKSTDAQKLAEQNVKFNIKGATTGTGTDAKKYIDTTASGTDVTIDLTTDAKNKIDNAANKDLDNLNPAGTKVITDIAKANDRSIDAKTYNPDDNGVVTMTYVDGNGTAITGREAKITGVARSDLKNITNEGKQAISSLGTVVKAGDRITIVEPTVDPTTGQKTYTISAAEQVEKVQAATSDDNLATVALAQGSAAGANATYEVSVSKQAVKDLVKSAGTKVLAGTNTTVTEGTEGDLTTYKVDVAGDLSKISSITNNPGNGALNFNTNGRVEVDGTTPITLNGNTGKITGLQNKTWDPANITSGQAATEDQLQKALQNTIKLGADGNTATNEQALSKSGGLQFNIKGTAGYVTTSATGADVTIDLDKAAKDKIDNAAKGWTVQVNDKNGNKQNSQTVQNETVTFKPGASGNIEIGMANERTITIETAKNLTADSFKAGNTTINNGGMTVAGGSGQPSTTYTNNGVTITPSSGDKNQTVSLTDGGLNNGGNKITNVEKGTDDGDAVNVSQLKEVRDNTIQLTGTTGETDKVKLSKEGGIQFKIEGADDYVTTEASTTDNTVKIKLADKAKIKYFSVKSTGGGNEANDGASGENAIAIGKDASSVADGAISMGLDSSSEGTYSISLGRGARSYASQMGNEARGGFGSIALGAKAIAGNSDNNNQFASTAVGGGANASGDGATSIGSSSEASAIRSTAIGLQSKASQDSAVAIGFLSQATNKAAISIGTGSSNTSTLASGESSVAIGSGANTSATSSVALGRLASVSAAGENGVALGRGASVTVANGVALGAESVASTAAGAQAFDPAAGREHFYEQARGDGAAAKSTRGAVAVGGRQITNLAGGTADTDAVNVAQLKAMNLKIAGDTTTDNKADVRLVEDTLTVKGAADSFITTKASGQTIEIATTFGKLSADSTGKISTPETDGLMKASDVANAINASGFRVNSATTGTGATLAGSMTDSSVVNPGELVTFRAGGNLKVNHTVDGTNTRVTYALNPVLTGLTSAEFKNGDLTTTVNSGGVTISKEGDSSDVKLSQTGLDNGGNTIKNVANGVDDNDAVNVSQLTKATNDMKAAEIHIKPTSDTNKYEVADDNSVTLAYVDGTGKDVENTKAVITGIARKADVDALKATTIQLGGNTGETTAKSLSSNVKFNVQGAGTVGEADNYITTKAEGDNVVVDLSKAAKDKLNHTYEVKGDSKGNVTVATDNTTDPNKTTFTVSVKETNLTNGKNTTVTGDGSSETPYAVNVEGALSGITSISNGNNGDKNNGAQITLNAGDKNISVNGGKITNVAEGENNTDAVNKGQLDKLGNNTVKLGAGTAAAISGTTDAQALNKDGGLQFNIVAGDNAKYVTIAAAGANVTVDLSQETKTKIDKAIDADAAKNADMRLVADPSGSYKVDNDGKVNLSVQNGEGGNKQTVTIEGIAKNDLSNITNDGKKVIAGLGSIVKAGTNVDSVETSTNDATGQVTYTVNAKAQVEKVVKAGNKANDENILEYSADKEGEAGATYTLGVSKSKIEEIAKGATSWKVSVNGTNATDVKNGETVDFIAGNNIAITQDRRNITIATKSEITADKVTVGKDGKDGTGVVINKDGTIGLNGKDGENGANTVISANKAKDGVNGAPGTKGLDGSITTRIEYKDGDTTRTVATTDDGMKYAGDDAQGTDKSKVIAKKLNETLDIIGGADKDSLTDNNIGVNATEGGKLKVQLAKDINLGPNGSVTTGNTTVNNGGVTVKGADGQPTTKYTNNGITITPSTGDATKNVTLTNEGLNNGGNTITNVADGKVEDGSKEAVNGGQLYNVSEAAKANRTTVQSSDKSITVTDNGDANKHAYDIVVNKQAIVEGAQLPVVYTDAQGNKVFKQTDGSFNTKADGTGTNVAASTVIASMNTGEDKTNTPMMLSNVASAVANQAGANYLDKLTAANTATPNAAVNVSDLNAATTALTTKGLSFATQTPNTTIKKELGQTLDIVGGGEKADSEYDASNIKTMTTTDGKVQIALAKDIKTNSVVVGEKGADGKDGVDGSIGVNGKDGSAVVINGKDGSIGLNGKDGANGLTINGAAGVPGVDGKDGTTTTRIVYKTEEGGNTTTHTVATLDDGMKYAGDDAQGTDKSKVIAKKLNQTVDIVGGADSTKLTDNNIGVNNVGGQLKVQLAKNLNLTNDGSITIGSGDNKVELSQNGLTNGGKAISNVASNLTAAPSDTTTSMNAPTATTSNAATVGDVLNAGWNLKENDTAKDFVKPYDTVNFANGTGTTAKVDVKDGTTSTVTYSVNAGNGLEVTTPANGNKLQVKTDGTTITIKDGAVAANTGGASEVTTAGTEANAPKVGQVQVNNGDSGKLATVDTVVQAVNSAKWFAKAGNDETVITDADQARDTDAAKAMAAGETLTLKAGKNLRVKQDNGTFTFALDKELKDINSVVVGEKGANGKDGVDGTIGVNGKDGSAVAINGKDGSIGLNGKDGANGLTIKGDKGSAGVDGTNGANGTDGMTRIVYTDGNNTKHEVATLDDGQKYAGDNYVAAANGAAEQNVIAKKLNERLDIIGGAAKDSLTDNNIGVNATEGGKLKVQLAKDINLGPNGSVTTGNTTVNNGGVTVKGADGQPTTTYTNNGITITPSAGTGDKVELNDKGLNNGGNTITNVADGKVEDGSKEAVNGGQLYTVSEAAKANRTTVRSSDNSISVTDESTDANKHAYDITVNKQAIVEGAQLPVVYTDKNGNKVYKQANSNKFNTKADGSGTEVTADNVIASMNNGSDSTSTPMMLSNVASAVAGRTTETAYLDKLAAAAKTDGTGTPNAAVNVSDLNAATTALTEKGLNFKAQAGNDIAKQLGQTLEIVGKGTGENSDYDATNIKTYTEDGKLVVAMAKDLRTNSVTTNNVTVGKDGKDGVDGTIGVNGKDGSAVVINGKDGSIGLNGKDGANGLTIKGDKGSVGVDGTNGANGTDGMTRIVYTDGNNTKHEVATLDDGLKFTGNNTTVENKHKLNTLVKVQGEGVSAENAADDKFKSAAGNINVVANGTDTLTVKLNKDVNLTESGSVTTGNAKMNNDGVVVQRVASSPIEGDVAYVASVAADKVALQDGLGNNANHKAQLAATGLTVSNKDGSVTTSVTEGLVRVGGTSPTTGGVLIGSQAANFSGNDATPDVRGSYITGLTNRTWEVGSTEPVFGRAATEDQLKVVSDAAKDAANNAANRNLSNITNEGNKVITALGTVVEAGDRVTVSSSEDKTTGRMTYKVSADKQVESVSAATLAGDTNLAQVTTLDGTQAGAANAKYAVSVSSKAISDIAKNADMRLVKNPNGGDYTVGTDGKVNLTVQNGEGGNQQTVTIAGIAKNDLSNITNDGKKVIAGLGSVVTNGKNVESVESKADATTGQVTYTVNAADQVEAVEKAAAATGDSNIADVTVVKGDKGKANTTYGVSVSRNAVANVAKESVKVVSGQNATVTKTNDNGADAYKVDVQGDLTKITSVTGGAGTGKVSFDSDGIVKVNGDHSISLDGKNGTITGLTNKDWNVENPNPTSGRAATEDQLKTVSEATKNLGNSTITLGGDNNSSTDAKQLKNNVKFNLNGSSDITTNAAGSAVTIDLAQATKEKINNAADKNLTNITDGGKTVISNIAKENDRSIAATTYNPDREGTITMTYVDGNGNAIANREAKITGVARSDLTNITDSAKAVIQSLTNVIAGENAKVTSSTENGVKTYTVSADKQVEQVVAKAGRDNLAVVSVKDGDTAGKANTTYEVNVSEKDVKKAARDAVKVVKADNSPITVASKTENDTTTYTVGFDGSLAARALPLTYKANGEGDKTVNLDKGLNFKNGTYTTASVADGGVVNFDLNKATADKINNAANINLSNITDAGKQAITALGSKVVAGTNIDSVTAKADDKTGQVTYTVNAKAQVESVGLAAAAKDDENIVTLTLDGKDNAAGTRYNVGVSKAKIQEIARDQAKEASAWFLKDGKDTGTGEKISGGDAVVIKNADGNNNITVARSNKTIAIGLASALKDITSIGGNGTTITFTNKGIDLGGRQITNLQSGGDVTTNAANIGDVQRISKANERHIKPGEYSVNNNQVTLTYVDGDNKDVAGSVVIKDIAKASEVTGLKSNTIQLGGNTGSTDTQQLSKAGGIKFDIKGAGSGADNHITTQANGSEVTIDLSQSTKDKINNATDKNLSNITNEGKKVITGLGTIVKGDSNVNVSETADATTGQKTYNVSLEPIVVIGDSNKVTINGKSGNIGGLTNKTWSPDNFVSGQAATEDQLKVVYDKFNNIDNDYNKGLTFKAQDGSSVSKKLGDTLDVVGENGITTTVVANGADNKLVVKLSNDLNIGQNGANGTDGRIGVNGKDGSSVVINGKDGSIGLNGANGKNGVTIKGADGAVGVDGKDGTTRIVYTDSDNKPHNVATTDDGMKFGGDQGTPVSRKLNTQVNVKGGATGELTEGNIGVVADGKDTLNVKLAKNVKGVESISKGDGKGGITLKDDGVRIDGGDLDLNNNRVTNVAPGRVAADSKDAVNGAQLHATNQAVINNARNIANLDGKINKVDRDMRAGVAGAMAIGGLYQVTIPGQTMVSAGVGTYKGQSAVAVGYSRLSDNGKIGVKFSVSGNTRGDTGAAASVGYRW